MRGKCLRQTVAITNDAEETRAVVHTMGKPLMESVYGNRLQQCAAKARMQGARCISRYCYNEVEHKIYGS